MILINKYIKLSSHMASMTPINDIPLIKPIIFLDLSIAKFLLKGVYVVLLSSGHNVVARRSNKLSKEFLDPFLQISKSEFGLGGRNSELFKLNKILL